MFGPSFFAGYFDSLQCGDSGTEKEREPSRMLQGAPANAALEGHSE